VDEKSSIKLLPELEFPNLKKDYIHNTLVDNDLLARTKTKT